MPVKPAERDRSAASNAVQQGQRAAHATAPSSPTSTSALSTQNLSYRPHFIQPTASRPRTDTASLASVRSFGKGDANTKGLIGLLTTVSPEDEPVKEPEDEDPQGLGSGGDPTVEMAQYQPQAQTVVTKVSAPAERHTVRPDLYVLTTASKMSATPPSGARGTVSPVATQAAPRTPALPGEKPRVEASRQRP